MKRNKTMRAARLEVERLHIQFHKVTDHKKPDHRAGYYDGVAAYIVTMIEGLERRMNLIESKLPRPKIRRALTPWQKHVRETLKSGGSIKAAAESWKIKR